MKRPLLAVLLMAIGILGLGVWIGSLGKGSLAAERDAWRRSAAESSRLITVAEGWYRRAAIELDGAKEARSLIEAQNADLARQLRRAHATVRSLQELVVTAPPDTVRVVAHDTVTVEGQTRVDFTLPFEVGVVTGYTTTPPPRAVGELLLNPLTIRTVMSELRDGSWQVDVILPPPYELGQLNTFTNPRKPSWWERNDFKIGIGVGAGVVIMILSAIGGGG